MICNKLLTPDPAFDLFGHHPYRKILGFDSTDLGRSLCGIDLDNNLVLDVVLV